MAHTSRSSGSQLIIVDVLAVLQTMANDHSFFAEEEVFKVQKFTSYVVAVLGRLFTHHSGV